MRLFRTSWMVPLLLAIGGCSSKPVKPLVELQSLRDKICACTNAACADPMQAAVARWTKRHGEPQAAKELLARVSLCHANAIGDPLAREAFIVLDGFRTKACACTNTTCATALQNEHSGWMRANGGRFANMKATPLQIEEGNRASADTQRCVNNVMNAAAKMSTAPKP